MAGNNVAVDLTSEQGQIVLASLPLATQNDWLRFEARRQVLNFKSAMTKYEVMRLRSLIERQELLRQLGARNVWSSIGASPPPNLQAGGCRAGRIEFTLAVRTERQRAGQIDKQPGFVRMQVLKPQSDDTPYVVLTSWQDKAAFEAWVGSDDFKLAHSNPMPREAFDGEGKLEMHEVIVAGERTA